MSKHSREETPIPTFKLTINRFELLHLRDLMTVALPPDGAKTVSATLAQLEDRSFVETKLWQKISDLCEEAKLPIGDEAPDFLVAPSAPPPMGVFQLAHDPDQSSNEDSALNLIEQIASGLTEEDTGGTSHEEVSDEEDADIEEIELEITTPRPRKKSTPVKKKTTPKKRAK